MFSCLQYEGQNFLIISSAKTFAVAQFRRKPLKRSVTINGCGRTRKLTLVLNQVLLFSVPLGIQNTRELTLEYCVNISVTLCFSQV